MRSKASSIDPDHLKDRRSIEDHQPSAATRVEVAIAAKPLGP